jgi:hypothetical protein
MGVTLIPMIASRKTPDDGVLEFKLLPAALAAGPSWASENVSNAGL